MENFTEYPGPGPADYANVLALNSAFLKARSDLKGPQRGRLAAAPFLLFSLRENDSDWWQQALADERQVELLPEADLTDADLYRIQTVAISFLWQLARQNPYAVRVLSGASIAWCDQIASMPLITLLERSARRGDLMTSRLDVNGTLGERLLGDDTGTCLDLRRSLQFAALQEMLTRRSDDQYARLPSAACRLSGPMQVLDKGYNTPLHERAHNKKPKQDLRQRQASTQGNRSRRRGR